MSEVGPASAQELIAVRALLERAGLPTSDLESARPEFWVIREQGQIIAAGALQRFGSSALLRSLVVAPERRGTGLGQAIVTELERLARAGQISRLVLLTQTAAAFFEHRGYRVIERSSTPAQMQGSAEFRSLCPSSATCMAKNLRNHLEQLDQAAPVGRELTFDKIQNLVPHTDAQRTLQAQAQSLAINLGQTRWLLFAQSGTSISTPFLVIVVFWLSVLYVSFGLFAPRNATAFITLLVSAVSVAGAMFLILDLDHPFSGLMQIPDTPLRNALAALGK